jgi:hypothetical protein
MNQSFSYYFCLMIEGSGSGSGRPKNMWIRIRIRIQLQIRDIKKNKTKNCPSSVEYLEKGESALFLCIQCVTSRQLAEITLTAVLLIHSRQSLRRDNAYRSPPHPFQTEPAQGDSVVNELL